MKCKECGSTSNEYNDSRGETSCKGCGLILMQNALEETVNIGKQEHAVKGSTLRNIKIQEKCDEKPECSCWKQDHGVIMLEIFHE